MITRDAFASQALLPHGSRNDDSFPGIGHAATLCLVAAVS
jgi:hypothetical protein